MRLTLTSVPDEALAIIDTGFNGELLVSQRDAKLLHIETTGLTEDVVLGDGSAIEAKKGRATIIWFDVPKRVVVFITADAEAASRSADEPVALVGTRLFADDILEINFPAKTVIIRPAE